MPEIIESVSIYIISDSLGETGAYITRAAISQFEGLNYNIKKIPYITDLESLKEALESIHKEKNSVIFYTLVDKSLVDYLCSFAKEHDIVAVDVLSPIIDAIKGYTGIEPISKPGKIIRIDEDYWRRIEAIEFAVKYDDGKDPRGILRGDLVIIGVSRTSKTPLSMYLADKRIKVVNIPLVPEIAAPKELYEIPARRIIGLTNSPNKLAAIREQRLKSLRLPPGSTYSSMDRILYEIDYAEEIMKRIGCLIIDVSNKAIEETADIIMDYAKKNKII
ncbi:MAG TPA: pyruvate, water dikinase regulatory protein [Tissierellaceae bacterium]|nr:pyruvate, water dikinase regulatory protein [Tissierellaceae bacterium]